MKKIEKGSIKLQVFAILLRGLYFTERLQPALYIYLTYTCFFFLSLCQWGIALNAATTAGSLWFGRFARMKLVYDFGLPPTQDANHKWRLIGIPDSLLKTKWSWSWWWLASWVRVLPMYNDSSQWENLLLRGLYGFPLPMSSTQTSEMCKSEEREKERDYAKQYFTDGSFKV